MKSFKVTIKPIQKSESLSTAFSGWELGKWFRRMVKANKKIMNRREPCAKEPIQEKWF
jgi:hypothetical protein